MGYTVGIDIGSTTVKVVVMEGEQLLFQRYERHFSQVRQKTAQMLEAAAPVLDGQTFTVALSGSAGFGLSKAADIPFVQEVYATSKAVDRFDRGIDVVIELGGEDAKILFLTGGVEERMNGTCAGGTGAFIDQMATLLDVTPEELDLLAARHEKLYPIASRCGVFAKSDIQPLLNQGARKEDLAASIFQAVVDQTITGLAQGREIKGKVAFLGGPLFFFRQLQERFVQTLHLTPENALFPQLGQYAVAMGAAIYAREAACGETTLQPLLERIQQATAASSTTNYLEPLFSGEADYTAFVERHRKATVPRRPLADYAGPAWLGIDCGSTTTKLVLIGADGAILYSYYDSNRGNPVTIIREQLMGLRRACGDRVEIRGSVVTGYGEELIQHAFHVDGGIVETMAHFEAARHFEPQVDFILDIGGQDIKCFKVRGNAIDSIMLNEACSSGCGSFLETFAKSMGYTIADFSQRGLFSQYPVDLGSRCTVFMNSSVKQAQKDGAGVEDISAGLSISVVKNAIYKVIRAHSPDELGTHIVVQGGTFLNDAVLRSFEREIGREVTRPDIAGLMGAYGAALHAKDLGLERSALLDLEELEQFSHKARSISCQGCANHCSLTINTFADGGKFISGNKCEKPLGVSGQERLPNIYQYKIDRIRALKPVEGARRGRIGIPLGLNMMENIPFWHAFFGSLGFEVVVSPVSTLETYNMGRYTIPSDTVCYPAKLMHGHMEWLLRQGIQTIFYPCLPYNFDEEKGDNHYNCPVVAYYPELLHANVPKLKEVNFLYPYFGLHRPADFVRKAAAYFGEKFPGISRREIRQAAKAAYAAYGSWKADLQAEGQRYIQYARAHGKKIAVLCGRPYHADPEINHGIDRLLGSLGMVVLSEDCVADLVDPQKVDVLNQWTYHARLYNAAKYVCTQPDMELIQLVSFGCGLDAITTDEVRAIMESHGRLYTQLKIDEISNLGAVRIRLRSLLGAVAARDRENAEAAARR